MSDRHRAGEQARTFFDDLWRTGDHWDLEGAAFEREKYARQFDLVADRRYARVLEIGCGSGVFSRALAGVADRVVALDVAPAAIDRARAAGTAAGAVEFRVADVMNCQPQADGPFDLVVMSETIYYLGWLYSFFDVAWLAGVLFDATSESGRFLMTNTYGGLKSHLHRPWIVQTYRDLFENVGYELETEEAFAGEKDGVQLEAMICLYRKPAGSPSVTA